MFKVGDLVYVSNPDTEYEKEYGAVELHVTAIRYQA